VKGPPAAGRPGPADTFAAEGAALIRERSQVDPVVAVVTGSGLREAVEPDIDPDREFSFQALPGFPPPTVPGHAGRLVLGTLHGVAAAVFLGRVHLYEGHGIGAATLIPRLAAELGASILVLTNAAGALDRALHPGRLMLIEDHLNLLGVNPLDGWRFPGGEPAFVDLSEVYDRGLLTLAEEVAAREKLAADRGVYVALSGPSYETPAETEHLRRAGGHAVGMSTVPEAVAGVALRMRVLGISCVTNMAGTSGTHEDVLTAAKRAAGDLRRMLSGVVPALATS
jgi:purine-nucleoside phosphorylase